MSYYKGETYKITVNVKDENGNLVDPSTISCAIIAPDGTEKSSGNMNRDAEGIYSYTYAIPSNASVGIWTAKVTATDLNGNTEIEETRFVVV